MRKDLRRWWIGILRGIALDFLIAVGLNACSVAGASVFFGVSVFKRLENVAFARVSEFLKSDSEDSKQDYGDWKRHSQGHGDSL